MEWKIVSTQIQVKYYIQQGDYVSVEYACLFVLFSVNNITQNAMNGL